MKSGAIRLDDKRHFVDRIGWLRAAVLGANDGLVSVASLIMGVAAASDSRSGILLAGAAGLVAGAMSMAAGEYVSVSSQADTEKADLIKEAAELAADPDGELDELTEIYRERGLDNMLARKVAITLMDKDALLAHARDELHITESTSARPVVAAITSAASFTVGAAFPLLAVVVAPREMLAPATAILTIFMLGALGAIGAKIGGAPLGRAVRRVVFWGALAMAVTAGIGSIAGIIV